MQPVKKQIKMQTMHKDAWWQTQMIIDVNEGYRKNILGCFDDYRDFLGCINSLQDPSNRIEFSPYRPSYVTPGSIQEWTYFKLLRMSQ